MTISDWEGKLLDVANSVLTSLKGQSGLLLIAGLHSAVAKCRWGAESQLLTDHPVSNGTEY